MKLLNSLLLFFILCLTTELVSQPSINETSQWKQYLEFGNNNCNCIEIKDQLYQPDGDTLIGNINYFKVLVTGIYTKIYQPGPTITDDIHYYADPIREENNIIYAFNKITNEEYLLYDFNLAIGDNVKTGHCLKNNISSIDSIYLGLEPRKRFHLPTGLPVEISTLVEGIGSTLGFYYQACNYYLPPGPQKLQCYCQDGNCITFDSTYNCNNLITETKDIQKYDIAITPNPFQDEIQIQFAITIDDKVTICVTNLMGELLFEKDFSSPQIFEIINVSNLPSGVYVISIQNKKGISSKKMIKL